MNIQKSLYQSLLRLGVNMIEPQEYVSIPLACDQKLVFALMKRVDGDFYALLAHYWLEGKQLVPLPDTVLRVSPSKKKATVTSRTWKTFREESSPELDWRVFAWMETQIWRGYSFQQRHPKQQENNVIPFRRGQHDSPL